MLVYQLYQKYIVLLDCLILLLRLFHLLLHLLELI
nr:MAG TPA: hypothetical protein [Caudoviricetes sp.]